MGNHRTTMMDLRMGMLIMRYVYVLAILFLSFFFDATLPLFPADHVSIAQCSHNGHHKRCGIKAPCSAVTAHTQSAIFAFAVYIGTSSVRKALSPGFKRSFSAIASPTERSPAAVSPVTPYVNASSSSVKPPLRANIEAEPRGKVDVGEDRPSHWNRMRPNAPSRTSTATSNKAAPKNPKLVSNVKSIKVAQIPKPKALPSQPAPLSFSENSRPSFRPSWLTSQSSQPSGPGTISSQPQTYRTQRVGTPAAEERLLIEAIQEEEEAPAAEAGGGNASYSATFRPPPQRGHMHNDASMGGGGFDEPSHVHEMISSSAALQARHPVAHVSLVSPQRALTVHALATPHNAFSAHSPALLTLPAGHDGSGSKLARGHSLHGGRAAGTSKARPGSLKAKLQKVWRDTDANENRIINIPVDPQSAKSRALDLQDPRSRAVHYVDAQIVEVLPDQAPFKVALLCVLGTWRKRGVEVEEEQIATGTTIVGLFKPDTCVGQGRGLEESAILRVYEPQMLQGRCVRGFTAHQVDYVMINTNCWELADTT